MNYDQNATDTAEELQPVTRDEIQENADSHTPTAPPVVRPELQPVVQPELQPVIPSETNGVVQKSLKLSSWLAKSLELEAAESSLPFNTHIVNILTNREKLADDMQNLRNQHGDLNQKYRSIQATNTELREENAALREALQSSDETTQTITPQVETMRRVLAGLIQDVCKASNFNPDALAAHAEALYLYYLENPDK